MRSETDMRGTLSQVRLGPQAEAYIKYATHSPTSRSNRRVQLLRSPSVCQYGYATNGLAGRTSAPRSLCAAIACSIMAVAACVRHCSRVARHPLRHRLVLCFHRNTNADGIGGHQLGYFIGSRDFHCRRHHCASGDAHSKGALRRNRHQHSRCNTSTCCSSSLGQSIGDLPRSSAPAHVRFGS